MPFQCKSEVVTIDKALCFVLSDFVRCEKLAPDIGFGHEIRIVNIDLDSGMSQLTDGMVQPDQPRQDQRSGPADPDQGDAHLSGMEIFNDMFHFSPQLYGLFRHYSGAVATAGTNHLHLRKS